MSRFGGNQEGRTFATCSMETGALGSGTEIEEVFDAAPAALTLPASLTCPVAGEQNVNGTRITRGLDRTLFFQKIHLCADLLLV